jgi:hypothetical protein
MNKLILTALTSILLAGCQSITKEQNILSSLKVASYLGTAISLSEHPEWKPKFEKAHGELLFIESLETIDFATILAIVNDLPVKELKSDKAIIIITGATIILSEYGKSIDIQNIEKLRPIAKALREGIALGLGQTPSAVASQNTVLILTQ